MTRRVKSHGCGRRMALNGPEEALAEAVERRARMMKAWSAARLDDARTRQLIPTPSRRRLLVEYGEATRDRDRRWADDYCVRFSICGANAFRATDVGLIDGVPVAMCADCRAHHASPPPADASGALL